jgi:hypothetical protein
MTLIDVNLLTVQLFTDLQHDILHNERSTAVCFFGKDSLVSRETARFCCGLARRATEWVQTKWVLFWCRHVKTIARVLAGVFGRAWSNVNLFVLRANVIQNGQPKHNVRASC